MRMAVEDFKLSYVSKPLPSHQLLNMLYHSHLWNTLLNICTNKQSKSIKKEREKNKSTLLSKNTNWKLIISWQNLWFQFKLELRNVAFCVWRKNTGYKEKITFKLKPHMTPKLGLKLDFIKGSRVLSPRHQACSPVKRKTAQKRRKKEEEEEEEET